MASSFKKNIGQIIWSISSYIVTNLVTICWFLFFRFCNKTTILGKENIPLKPNTLLLSNHQTMIDSFPVGLFAFFPYTLIRPSLIPWNPAAEENFFGSPLVAWLFSNMKCIPIRPGRKDSGALFKMARALKCGPMTIFPEGTRSRNGVIGKGRGGAGMLILETQPAIIPVCISGMDSVLPIGAVVPRIGKKVYISYGKPMDLSMYYERGKSKEVAVALVAHIMDEIRSLNEEIEDLKKNHQQEQNKADPSLADH